VTALLVALFGIAFALVLWWFGANAFGFNTTQASGQSVVATVTHGAVCGQSANGESVTFKQDGSERQARLDACGHQDGETVTVTLPEGAAGGQLVVHAEQAGTGMNDVRRRVALPLLVLGTYAGAGYAFLVRRGPRRPATATRPASATA
jgi:hypothetical protein